VIGVAPSGWNVGQLRERSRDAVAAFGDGIEDSTAIVDVAEQFRGTPIGLFDLFNRALASLSLPGLGG
jgi:hypothetical protein